MINNLKPSKFAAQNSQTERLAERHLAKPLEVTSCGLGIKIFGGVYKTSADTELMAKTAKINSNQSFLEVGCGAGVVSIILSKSAKSGIGTDINELAVRNSEFNARRYKIKNVKFIKSDLFENIHDKFDVIICNPPYNNLPANDDVDKMFWDANNEMKRRFFEEVGNHLNDNGCIYFGWANFSDLDLNLPFRLAQKNNLKVVDVKRKLSPHKACTFYVMKIKRK